jgi:glyoxylase-like metal-dependent hydrolase (beta-lactamase superfamily II)
MNTRIGSVAAVLLLGLAASTTAAAQPPPLAEAPDGFIAPPLHPAGAELETLELAPDVYALMSTKVPVDNSGFIVGERGVLVVDAHINGEMAHKIQAAVREVTDRPILYVVNTNYHGDHTFGNYAFPARTEIVAHRETAERMKDFEGEKKLLLATVENDSLVYADVRLRLPDIAFDRYLRLDLGGKVVEVYHFGHGNTPGDAVVYVPESRIAWTGNLLLGEGTIPFLLEGDAEAYVRTIDEFANTLAPETIVGGHGPLMSVGILDRYRAYLTSIVASVDRATRLGMTLEETLAEVALNEGYNAPNSLFEPAFINGLHRFNVWMAYLDASRDRAD